MQNNNSFGHYDRIIIHTPHAGTKLPIRYEVPKHITPAMRNKAVEAFINHYHKQLCDHCTDKPYHSLMIEVNKHCYMNEDTLEKTEGFDKLHAELQELYKLLLNY